MCLAAISTTHPTYPFILLSNRDELLHRTTKPAGWWDAPEGHVLGGRDMQHPSHGTWLGVTKQGRVALLTNFREDVKTQQHFIRSRGELTKLFLTADATESPHAFAERLFTHERVTEMDGFSLIFGYMQPVDPKAGTRGPLGIISNRTPDAHGTVWVAGDRNHTWGQTCALSNSRYGDRAWPKVVKIENALEQTVQSHAAGGRSQDELLRACFDVLSRNTLLPRSESGEPWDTYTQQLRNTIFVPRSIVDDDKAHLSPEDARREGSSIYCTQMQTVILVDRHQRVTFIERTLYDQDAVPLSAETRDRRFDFVIEPPANSTK